MRLVDANLLLYAKFEDFPQHQKARDWLESSLAESTRLGFPWASSLAFVRLATNPRLFARPLAAVAAWQQIEEWLDHPRAWIPEPTDAHRRVLGELLVEGKATGNLVPDAHLATLAVEHGLIVCSADADFARFPGVDWENPLVVEN